MVVHVERPHANPHVRGLHGTPPTPTKHAAVHLFAGRRGTPQARGGLVVPDNTYHTRAGPCSCALSSHGCVLRLHLAPLPPPSHGFTTTSTALHHANADAGLVDDEELGVRRSTRSRIQPLQYWRGEKKTYGRHESACGWCRRVQGAAGWGAGWVHPCACAHTNLHHSRVQLAHMLVLCGGNGEGRRHAWHVGWVGEGRRTAGGHACRQATTS